MVKAAVGKILLLGLPLCLAFLPAVRAAEKPAASVRGVPVVNEALLKAYRKNSAIIKGDHEKAYRVNEARLAEYYNELVKYYSDRYQLKEPIADRRILDLYSEWMKTLPTPTLEVMARSTIVLQAFTILFSARVAAVEAELGKTVSIVQPPPFIVNVDVHDSTGRPVPVPVATAPMVDRMFEAPRLVTDQFVIQITDKIEEFEASQKNFRLVAAVLVLVALAGVGLGILGLKKSRR